MKCPAVSIGQFFNSSLYTSRALVQSPIAANDRNDIIDIHWLQPRDDGGYEYFFNIQWEISPLGPASFRSFPCHFSQIVWQSLTDLWIGRGSSCCWIHRPPLQFCPVSQAFWTSPESEASKHKCQGPNWSQVSKAIANPTFRLILCWLGWCVRLGQNSQRLIRAGCSFFCASCASSPPHHPHPSSHARFAELPVINVG